ncbi:MAG: dockerin type I repeat-containing protein [Deltaproteobacteria bacterium]|nr:dockerin type I repeat-containing protein [Deltaproteobacteria bacterium]
MDVNENTSSPKEARIYQVSGEEDIYEPDGKRSQANVIVLDHLTPQPHNFHIADDEDWVKFYGLNGEYYTILAGNLGDNCNPIIELYYEDDSIPIEVEVIFLNSTVSIDFECLEDGIYYVLLYNRTDGEDTGYEDSEKTGYELQIYHSNWPDIPVLITGRVEDQITRQGIDGAVIKTSGGGSSISVGGRYHLDQIPGKGTISASKVGYAFYFRPLIIEVGGPLIVGKDILMVPTLPAIPDEDRDGIPDSKDNCPYHSNSGQEDSNGNGIGDACEGDKGDVNDSGGIDPGDVQMIINIFLGDDSHSGMEYWAADCDGDGVVNESDVKTAINNYLY